MSWAVGRGQWDRRPVLCLPAGGHGDHTDWTTGATVREPPELRDVQVVMPGMPLFGFWTDCRNHGAGGPPRTETWCLREVLPLMERKYGARTRRAAGGESRGGFGRYGLRRR